MLAAPVITGRCLAVPGGRCAHGSADLDRNQPSLGFPSRTWIRRGGTDSCSVFSYSEFKLVPGSTSFHLASLNQHGPHFSCQQYALVCAAFLISACLAVFLLRLLFLPSGSPGLTWYSELLKLNSKIGLC